MNLLLTGAWQGARDHIPELEAMGHCVCFLQCEGDALPCEYEWVEGVVGNGLFLHHAIERFTNLKFIQLTSAGYDRVPMDYVRARGIEIHNAGGVYSIPMAEFAVAGVLQLYKQSRFFCDRQRQRVWEKHRGLRELNGKTVCIVGCGDVGKECAKRFEAFGCEVIGVNRTVRDMPHFRAVYPLGEIGAALKASDIVVMTVALTDETRHLMNAERFSLLKCDAVLVNISRGATVDTAALIEWLRCSPASGAVLDVLEEEPLPSDSELWERDNAIITPHNSFVGEGNGERLMRKIMRNLEGRI